MKTSPFLFLVGFLLVSSARAAFRIAAPVTFGDRTTQRQNEYVRALQSSKRNENRDAENLAAENGTSEGWRDARVVVSRPACPSGKSTVVELEVDATTREEYRTPGQFVQFRWKDTIDPIFLAMSSAPSSSGTFQFLIKNSPRLGWLKDALVEGNSVQISAVVGDGFPIDDLLKTTNDTNDGLTIDTLLLAAAGSGIAPIKACIESGLLPLQKRSSTLYYGEWTPEDLCFSECYETWEAVMGITIVPVLSQTDTSRGYVQEVLQKEGVGASVDTTAAILCGMDDMVQCVSSVLKEAGMPEERILLNL